jgi:hypothetical protein
MNLLTAIVAGAGVALIVWTAHAEQIEVSGHDILSIGDHGKILNNTTVRLQNAK